jgi:hypothetical protein
LTSYLAEAQEIPMKRTNILKALVVATALPLLYLADISPDAPLGLTLVREAHAIVGAPMTPISVAGVARRTTARVVVAETAAVGATAAATNSAAVSQQQAATAQQQAATAQQQAATAQQQAAAARPAGAPAVGTVVNTLPAGCVPEVKGGVEYQKCGGVYYRSAFQGNNLVYVAQ